MGKIKCLPERFATFWRGLNLNISYIGPHFAGKCNAAHYN